MGRRNQAHLPRKRRGIVVIPPFTLSFWSEPLGEAIESQSHHIVILERAFGEAIESQSRHIVILERAFGEAIESPLRSYRSFHSLQDDKKTSTICHTD